MKREDKSGDGVAEKEENLGLKLKRRVLFTKRCGPTTPVKLGFAARDNIINVNNNAPFFNKNTTTDNLSLSLLLFHDNTKLSTTTNTVSARKLAAALWEFHHYFPTLARMHRSVHNNTNGNHNGIVIGGGGGGGGGSGVVGNGGPPRLRRLHKDKDKEGGGGGGGGRFDLSQFLVDPGPSSPDQPSSASSLRRQVVASLLQHHRAIDRNNHAIQPLSPASYGSSMEVTPYNPAVTPSSSLDFRGRVHESQYNLKTSTELLKVLNRIWSLEEQHACNVSLIKALKTELDHARMRIKEMVQDQRSDRHEIDTLMKQLAEDKLIRKSKEQDRIHAAVQSVRDELEDERKLRKRSESLHRKLARELSDAKTSLSNALGELEKERKSRRLLEDLIDEFAVGIRDYEHEMHALRQKADKEWVGSTDHDRLILHISESWLDERMQMKLEEAQNGVTGASVNESIVDKFCLEIETFIQAKRKGNLKSVDNLVTRERRNSLESVPLKDIMSAPRGLGDEEDSDSSDSNCFELKKQTNDDSRDPEDHDVDAQVDEKVETDLIKKKSVSRGRRKAHPSYQQDSLKEQIARALSSNRNKSPQTMDADKEKTTAEITSPHKFDINEAAEDANQGRKTVDDIHGSNTSHMVDDLIRNQLSLAGGVGIRSDVDYREASSSTAAWRTQASPVRQWTEKLTPPNLDVTESSSKIPSALKENTLKSKLLEARSKGQRSRFKLSKGFSYS